MKALTLEEIVTALEGTMDRPVPAGSVRRVTTDSRQVEHGDLFIALKGERFDGHDYVPRAFARGATAAVVREEYDPFETQESSGATPLAPEAILIRVDDPVRAMGRLARYYRRSVIGRSATIVAVTGSNGKTTTKSMIAHVLSGRWQGLASVKSFNNEIGVPLTLLSADTHDRFVICEIGTNASGEIAHLAHMVEPDIAVVVGVSEAHLEGLGTLHDVAVEKLSLFKFLRSDGCAVVNSDQNVIADAIRTDYDLKNLKYVRFGQSAEADLRLTDTRITSSNKRPPGVAFTVNDRFHYKLNVPGRHNVINAMAAIAVARRFNMDHDEIAARLATFELPPMRLQRECVAGVTLINDAYNANPASLAATVDVLAAEATQGRRVLIVGDMRELGVETERLHRQAAENIGRSPIDVVISVGGQARLIASTVRQVSGGRIETHAYATTALARRRVTQYVRIGDTIALKGSRLLGLEVLAQRIRDRLLADRKSEPPTEVRSQSEPPTEVGGRTKTTRKRAAQKSARRKKKSPRVTI